jgi:hypothetical protein
VHGPELLPELGEVLAMLEGLEQVALPPFLGMGQGLEDAMAVEEGADLPKALGDAFRRATGRG